MLAGRAFGLNWTQEVAKGVTVVFEDGNVIVRQWAGSKQATVELGHGDRSPVGSPRSYRTPR